MNLKKRLLSFITATAIAASAFVSAVSVSALEYGSEWGGQNQTTQTSPVIDNSVTSAPAAAIETTSAAPAATGTYKDVPSTHWAYEAVERCSKAHWFAGYPDGSFKPNGEILRSEAMKVFVAILGYPLNDVTSPTYYDVKATDWYAPYVEAGKHLFPEMTADDGQKKFQPTMPITREVAIYALVKTLGYDSEVKFADESVLNMFTDYKTISTNLRPYLAWAISDGLASGYPDGRIGAQDPLTRAEFATILYRANVTHGFNNTGFVEKVISSIKIDPETYKEIMVGESFEITATVNYSDGTSEDYTNNLNPYTDSIEGVITINKNKVTGVAPGTVLINYNSEDEAASSQTLVVQVKQDESVTITPEPTVEPTAEPDPEIAGVVKANVDKVDMPVNKKKRYTVLVLDESGSMYGEKLTAAKNAAKSFCSTLMNSNTDDYVAVVSFESDSKVRCEFSNNINELNSAIDQMDASWATNIYDGIKDAETLLDNVTDTDVQAKSIVLMTDGYPCAGKTSATGHYTQAEAPYDYEYANPIYDATQECINKSYDMYTVAFYETVEEQNSFSRRMLEDIQNKGFYLATNTDKLEDIFNVIGTAMIVSGVNVALKKGENIIDSCSTNKGACDFSFTVNPDDYTLMVSAPGYQTYSKDITVNSNETVDLGDIVLDIE